MAGVWAGLICQVWRLDQAKHKILAPREGAIMGPVLKID